MRFFSALVVLVAISLAQPSPAQAQKLSGAEWLTPEERSSFNDRFADAPDSATRARIRQEQLKLIQQRRLDARRQKNVNEKNATQ